MRDSVPDAGTDRLRDGLSALDLGTSQAVAMKIPACISGTGKSFPAWCKIGVDDVESEMTQPAKVQEPSMEEILASIRRIIADDEAKPAGDKAPAAAAPAAKPAMKDIPPSAIPAAQVAAKPARASQTCRAATAAAGSCRREQQPGRHRRHAGEPRRGDARVRHPAAATRRGSVRSHRRDGVAGSAATASRAAAGVGVPEGRSAGRSRIFRSRCQDEAAPADV